MPPQSFPECLLFCWLSCVCVCVRVWIASYIRWQQTTVPVIRQEYSRCTHTHSKNLTCTHMRNVAMTTKVWPAWLSLGLLNHTAQEDVFCWRWQKTKIGKYNVFKSEPDKMFVQKTTTKKKKHDWNVFICQLMAERVDWVQHCLNSAGGEQRSCVDLCSLIFFLYLDCSITLRFPPSIRTDEGPRRIGPLKFSRLISVVFFYSSRSTLSLFNTHTHWIEAKTVWVEGQQ